MQNVNHHIILISDGYIQTNFVRPPPAPFFHFHAVYVKICANNRLAPLWGWHFLLEILDLPLLI